MKITAATKSRITVFDRANYQLQNIFQNHQQTTACILLSAWLSGTELTFTSILPLLKYTTYHLAVLTSTAQSQWTFSKHWWMSLGAIFSTWRNSMTYLYFIHISTSDTILSHCPSAALCPTTTKCNGTLLGRFSLHYLITKIHLWCNSQHLKIGGITYGAAPV